MFSESKVYSNSRKGSFRLPVLDLKLEVLLEFIDDSEVDLEDDGLRKESVCQNELPGIFVEFEV
jgi:hypothetical protein